MKPINNEKLSYKAYKILKKEIINGNIEENQTLPEEKIAKQLGISRTPLRDALNMLAQDGLIIQETGKPATVAMFNKDKALEIMEVRRILEVNNIEKIINKIDVQFINELKNNVSSQLKAIESNSYESFIELDRDFHLLLASKNNNLTYKELILKVNTSVNRAFLILSKTLPNSAMDAYLEHLEIISALEKKEVSISKNKMIIHMNNVEKRFLTYYSKLPNSDK